MTRIETKSNTGDKALNLPLYVCLLGIALGISFVFRVWQIGDNGFSLVSKTTPYWDFNNLWSGSKMAIEGNVDWLFDTEKYRAALQERISPDIPDHEWSYPPNMLLLGQLLARIPIFPAYILWTLSTIGALYLAARTLNLSKWQTLAITFSPAVFYNAVYGQNGALTGALLIAGLALAPKRPVLAGVFIGLLTIKPQFGLLIPFILLANRNWKMIGSAAITSILLASVTGVMFGFDSWIKFFTQTQPLMKSIMEAPYMQPFQINAGTVFIGMRALGVSLPVTYAIQFAVIIGCLAYGIYIWRKSYQIDHRLRVAITCVLVFLATPYAYTYDMTAIMAAIVVFYALIPNMKFMPVLGMAWLFPLINHVIVVKVSYNFGWIVLAVLLFTMLFALRSQSTQRVSA